MPALTCLFGKQGLILASPSVKEKVLPGCGLDWRTHGIPVEAFTGECCEEELARVAGLIEQWHADVLIGMGGGKTIDTAKIAADRARIPVVIVPSIASTDAPCSGCAVIYSREGVFQSVDYQRANPAAVLVDVGIIAAAPTRFLVAGMGDVGLPTTLADIGLGDADREHLMKAAVKACEPGQSIHHEAGVITPDRVLDAMLAADALGRENRGSWQNRG